MRWRRQRLCPPWQRRGSATALVAAAGTALRGAGEPDLQVASAGEAWVVIPAARLDPDFFRLSSGLAGGITQKFAAYRTRLAVVGEHPPAAAGSASWRAFVLEANRGSVLWLLPDLAAFAARLRPLPPRGQGL